MYFNYEEIDFKLIKGTKKYQDILCCITDVESSSGPSEREARRVQEIALRFLSCLSWELNIGITPSTSYGSGGWSKERGGLSRVKRCTLIPRSFRTRRVKDIVKLPKIDDKYKANALSLFREAKATNSLYYKFLCYWKILEVYNTYRKEKGIHTPETSVEWINHCIDENKWILERAHFNEQLSKKKTIGKYLEDECRTAIAHVMAKYKLAPDSGEGMSKIYTATIIIEELARIFIQQELGLKFKRDQSDNYFFLQKIRRKSIPIFK